MAGRIARTHPARHPQNEKCPPLVRQRRAREETPNRKVPAMTNEDWTRLDADPRVTISRTGSWLESDSPKVETS